MGKMESCLIWQNNQEQHICVLFSMYSIMCIGKYDYPQVTTFARDKHE